MFDELFEVTGLGKGLGSAGAKMSKAVGLAGVDVSPGSGVKALQPPAQKAEEPEAGAAPEAEMTPEEEAALAAEEGPETVEKLPKPVKLEYDKLGAPDKSKMTGHTVRRDGRNYVLDWDDDYEVYKLVDPDTLRVKTRVRPESVSTIDFRSKTIRESVTWAAQEILAGATPSIAVEVLLEELDV